MKVLNNQPVIITLSNGLEVHLINLNSKMTYVELTVPLGHFHEKFTFNNKTFDITLGAPHFLEHLMFNTKEGDGLTEFSKLGISANAHTGYKTTSYIFNGNENIIEATKYLIEMILTPYFDDKKILSEKKIIKDEINMYEDNPLSLIARKMAGQLFLDHPLLVDILGRKSELDEHTVDSLTKLHNAFYQPHLMKLFIMGPINDEFKNELSSLNFNKPVIKDLKIIPNEEPKHIVLKEDYFELNIEVPIFVLGYKYQIHTNSEKDVYKTRLLMEILYRIIFGKHTKFINNLIDTGLIYELFEYEIMMEDKTLALLMFAHTNDANKLKESIKNYFDTDAINEITADKVNLVKNYHLGTYIMDLDDFEYRLSTYSELYFDHLTFEDAINMINDITLDDVLGMFYAFEENLISYLSVFPK